MDNVSRFTTKKWIEVNDQSGSADDRYKTSKQIRFKTPMLRSDLSDYSDTYIVVTGKITVVKRLFTIADFVASNNTQAVATATNIANTNNVINEKLAFKNSAPFISCVSKINNVLINNTDDLDVVCLCTI